MNGPVIHEVSPEVPVGIWRERFMKKKCFSLEWKSVEGVIDGESGEDEAGKLTWW